MTEGDTKADRPGVWTSVQRVFDTLLASAETRVELLGIELRQEKCRWIQAFLLAGAVAAFGMMTLTLLTLTIVVLFWENGRLPALVGLSFLYLVGTGLAWNALRSRLSGPTAFQSTLDELRKDRACLDPKN